MVVYYLEHADGGGDNRRVLAKATDIAFAEKQAEYELFT